MSQPLPNNLYRFKQSNHQNRSCLQCLKYQQSLNKMSQIQGKLVQENHHLHQTIKQFQQQNLQMMGKCGNTYRQYQVFVNRLNQQLAIRDSTIERLQAQLHQFEEQYERLELQSEQKQDEYEKKIIELQNSVIDLQQICEQLEKKQQSHKQKQLLQMKQNQRKKNEEQSGSLKKIQDKLKKLEQQKIALKKQIQTNEEIIHQKQEIMKKFSKNNDQLRLELIELKTKHEINQSYLHKEKSVSQYQTERQQKYKYDSKIKQLEDKLFQSHLQVTYLKQKIKQYQQSQKKNKANTNRSRAIGKLKKQSSFQDKVDQNLLTTAIDTLIIIYQICCKVTGNLQNRLLYYRQQIAENLGVENINEIGNQIRQMIKQMQPEIKNLINSQYLHKKHAMSLSAIKPN